MYDHLIGKSVKYYDYLECERFGKIIAVEPYHKDDTLAYVYIEDDDVNENTHQDIVNGQEILYADIRLSNQVYLDE